MLIWNGLNLGFYVDAQLPISLVDFVVQADGIQYSKGIASMMQYEHLLL